MSSAGSGENAKSQIGLLEAPEHTYLFPKVKGHGRSVSHGGASSLGNNSLAAPGRPSALRSANRGHQRAFSHGQIGEGPSRPGHSRTASKTDFILPPGYREPSAALSNQTGRSSAKGHSRQASRSESIYTLRRTSGPPIWRRAIGWLLRRPLSAEERRYRIVVPNHTVPESTTKKDHPNGKIVDNKVRTTKYTFLSFIPKNLLEQFHRVANLYFIFIVLLNWFPAINAFGKEIAMIPVLFVLGVTAVKDLFEDRRRYLSDNRINNSTCRVYKRSCDRYKKVLWKNLRVGDLVHLSNNEIVPADMVLLRSSDSSGLCYLDTCNLDGESNLKPRQVATGFQEKQPTFTAGKFVSKVEVDSPSTKIYRFHGALLHPNGKKVPLNSDNLLLRECKVKNTDYIEGIVVYAGHETKAMLNNGGPRYKRSKLERQMNMDVIWCVLMLLVMCCIGAVGCKLWYDQHAPSPPSPSLSPFNEDNVGIARSLPPYIPHARDPAYEGLLSFWTFIIILQVMIPLSLYVTIEMTKIVQIYHIHNNIDLYDSATNKRIECRALNITEELGQIEYVFSDKTGTLTENKMIFRRCTIAGVDYNHPSPIKAHPMGSLQNSAETPTFISANSQILEELSSENFTDGSQAQRLREFLLVLALCNTVVVSHTPHHDNMDASGIVESPPPNSGLRTPKFVANGTKIKAKQLPLTTEKYSRLAESRSVTPSPPPSTLPSPRPQPGLPPIPPSPPERPRLLQIPNISIFNRKRKIENGRNSTYSNNSAEMTSLSTKPILEAESPDELALVEAAMTYGCRLEKRTPKEVIISIDGEFLSVPVLNILPFDSTRKCMSVVLRLPNSPVVTIYSKGADTTILAALNPSPEGSAERAALMRTQQQLDAYGRQGLRTLVMAKRTISVQQYEDWAEDLRQAELSLDNRDKKIRECYNILENGFTLLGATGIEDRLQEGVPHTIAALIEAGIMVWVLTGDKPETAINVAYSAKLFSPQVELLKLMARSKDQAESTIKCYLDVMDNKAICEEGNGIMVGPLNTKSSKGRALVVDGKTLTFILDKKSNLTGPFLSLTRRCTSVLCCRATPLQKAYIVKVVKEEMGVRTLAIGDGANDVSMIQTADVGIGISGQEGMQAVMASDFAISRFKFLERFLLVHGHWCYNRLARMILYFFYKNATFVFMIFWFQLYCGWSASVMVDQMFLMLYNLMFTSLPPLAIGVYDRCAPESLLLERPGLYAASRSGRTYRPRSYWLAIADAIYQSVAIFFISLYAFWDSTVDIWIFGATISSTCIVVMLLHVAIETRSWTILHVLSLLGSLGLYFGFTLIYNAIPLQELGLPSSNYWVMETAFTTPEYWLITILCSVVALAPRLFWRAVSASLWPGLLGRAVMQRRRDKKNGDPLGAHYHNASHSTHIYRSTVDNTLGKHTTLTAVG